MKIRISLEQQDVEGFIDSITRKYHYECSDAKSLLDVYEKLRLCMSPYAIYRINQSYTGVGIIDDNQVAIVAMTLGAGVDRLKERFIRGQMLDMAYMLDCITAELLLCMYKEFNKSYARFHRRYVQRYVFIGNEIPSEQIPDILNQLKGIQKNENAEEAFDITDRDTTEKAMSDDDITSNEYGALMPSKSVLFYAVLSENPATVCEGICDACANVGCENRVENKQVNINENEEGKRVSDAAKYSYGYQRIFGSS